jgi:hypothetical protein
MLKVGLTGSIAVGKSFVCEVFRELGASVLDADQTAREVVAPETEGLKRIVETFGVQILTERGELDRAKLGVLVFADEAKRQLLNRIVCKAGRPTDNRRTDDNGNRHQTNDNQTENGELVFQKALPSVSPKRRTFYNFWIFCHKFKFRIQRQNFLLKFIHSEFAGLKMRRKYRLSS